MGNTYAKIVRENLDTLYRDLPENLAQMLPAKRENDHFLFTAFGERCRIQPDGIFWAEEKQSGVLGILISLYALHSQTESCVIDPLKAYKDFPNSMPYVGAFATHTEQLLVPYVKNIQNTQQSILNKLGGQMAPSRIGGDFAFIIFPLPKIALCYIFYLADDEFPASVTCLFSSNAGSFMPIDGLADVGEYTSKTILKLIE